MSTFVVAGPHFLKIGVPAMARLALICGCMHCGGRSPSNRANVRTQRRVTLATRLRSQYRLRGRQGLPASPMPRSCGTGSDLWQTGADRTERSPCPSCAYQSPVPVQSCSSAGSLINAVNGKRFLRALRATFDNLLLNFADLVELLEFLRVCHVVEFDTYTHWAVRQR